VLRVKLAEQREPATFVGECAQVAPGEVVRAEGSWQTSPSFGPQFRTRAIAVVPPSTTEGMEAYLASGMIKGIGRAERRRRVADVMDRCLIADVQNRLIGTLSKGYRQRVGLAQAIVSDPHVLILDEPTIGLDPRQIKEIRALIKSLAGEHTVILSTHILPEVSMVCNSVVIINRGAIVAQGPIDMLVDQFFPSSRVEVEIAAPTPAVRDAMRAIPGVLGVTEVTGDGTGRYVVEAARARDVRAEIFQLAAQQRWNLRELRRVGMTLEEVFMRVVAGEETTPEPPVEPQPEPPVEVEAPS